MVDFYLTTRVASLATLRAFVTNSSKFVEILTKNITYYFSYTIFECSKYQALQILSTSKQILFFITISTNQSKTE
jgi:hypothetical protein